MAEEEEVDVTLPKSRALFRSYLAWLILIPLTLYFAAFFLVRTPTYERWGGSAWGPVLDYAFQTPQQDADVLIFGDSSALFGLDPLQMQRELGLKVVNLPNTIGGLPVIGDMALKRYMSSNRPPALILFYFCPWDLDYSSAKGSRLFEGEEMLVRHGSRKQIMDYAIHHPKEAFYFPFRVYSGFGPGALLHLVHPGSAEPEVVQNRGHVANHLQYDPLASDCAIPEKDIRENRDASVRRLMARYATVRTATMLYLAPIPGCANATALLAAAKVHFHQAPPAVFPPADFTSDTYYAHLRPDAVGLATTMASQAIRKYVTSVQTEQAQGSNVSPLKVSQRDAATKE